MKPQPTTKPTISLAAGNFSQIKINFLPTNANVQIVFNLDILLLLQTNKSQVSKNGKQIMTFLFLVLLVFTTLQKV